MKSFTNKVAAITGAGSGIGRALALRLADAGAELALSDIDEKGLEETARLAREKGFKVTTTVLDVAKREAVYAWADSVVREHGRVNLIFNNAGVSVGATVENVSYEDFEWLMDINFWGVVYGTKAFLPHLHAAGEGHVINISSIFGLFGVPGQGTYNASKFAVRGLTEALRQELDLKGDKVSATSVHPGGIKTNIARASRISEEITALSKQKNAADTKTSFEKMFITSADSAARTILKGVLRNDRRVLVGPDAVALSLLVRAFPVAYQSAIVAFARRGLPS